ncbi:hypothetical protein KH5H1_50520 [Corallococcus caeni]|uniref:carboxypeptidase-like regulatory domain-containing protein n=1 Tax=Corallococcus caeni TaxID=3082388 RepID=UPI0029580347|nr:hypothetical protein KH5H1_50520 [Corallococcus sp. KH5-1]
MRSLLHVLPVLMLWLSAEPAQAQSANHGNTIFGTVIDVHTRKPIMDVVVSLNSPANFPPGEKSVITDAQGNFRFTFLDPGRYSLQFAWLDHQPYKREDLQLQEGHSLRVRVELDSKAEPVVIACGPPPPGFDAGPMPDASTDHAVESPPAQSK